MFWYNLSLPVKLALLSEMNLLLGDGETDCCLVFRYHLRLAHTINSEIYRREYPRPISVRTFDEVSRVHVPRVITVECTAPVDKHIVGIRR